MIPQGMEIDRGAEENRFPSLSLLPALPQAGFSGADDRLGPVNNLKLGEDVGDVVANGLGAQRQLPGDRRVGVSLCDEVQDLTLAVCERGEGLGWGASLGRGREVG
jgi:hypothetical protein